MFGSPEAVVAGAVGSSLACEAQRLRRRDRQRRRRLTATGEDVQDDIGGMNALGRRLGTGGLDRLEPSVSTAPRMSTIWAIAVRHPA